MSISIHAGFVGFGEVNTPREFIDARVAHAADELRKRGVLLSVTAPVSDDPDGAQAARAVKELSASEFDALVVCVAGWIPTWAVMNVIEPFKHKPILLWGLSGWRAGGHFITTADQAGTTALRGPMKEMGFRFKYLVNFKDAPPRYDEAADFLRAASVHAAMRKAKIGMAGYRDMRLYGTMYDGMALKDVVGAEIEHFDLLELRDKADAVTPEQVREYTALMRKNWKFLAEPKPDTFENSVRLALAVTAKVRERKYDAFSFCDVDGVKKLFHFAPAGAMTLFHDLADVPSVPENDSYGSVLEVILRHLTGQLPFYMEFYEFTRDSALMGVPDYVPSSATENGVTVMPNAFGSFGEGLLNVSKVKPGPVTMARLARVNGQFTIHMAYADAVPPEPWEEAGWAPPAPQLPSLEMKFGKSAEGFVQNVMSQHYILTRGDNRGIIREYASVAGIALIEF